MKKMSDIRIVNVNGIVYDNILGWTADERMTTISYSINGKQRTISLESEEIEIELIDNV